MTGLDCLREEMAKRGLTQVQIESKTAAVMLDIFTNSGDKYRQKWEDEQEETKRLTAARRELYQIIRRETELKINERNLEKMEEAAEKQIEEYKAYIDEFNKSLQECETEEGRDTMRIAQMFVNSVDVDTKYDNTAYIIGLASILSRGGVNAITELKKINKKIPSPSYWKEDLIRL